MKVTKFGEKIRELREKQSLYQRQLAASLEIDTALLSKIEKGERKAKKEQVQQLAVLLHTDKDELMSLWLAEQILELPADDEEILNAIKKAIKYIKAKKEN